MERPVVSPLREETRTLSEQVYSALLAAILERRIRPGQRLALEDLAAQLRVSRTPVREALARLAAEGLVQPADRRGFSVTTLSYHDLVNLYDLRLMCELYAVEKGMVNLTPELLDRMQALVDECIQLGDPFAPSALLPLAEKDRDFHLLIISLAGNPRLTDMVLRLNTHTQYWRVYLGPVKPEDLMKAHRSEHPDILDALRGRDVAATRTAIAAHLRDSLQRAIASLQLDSPVRGDAPAGLAAHALAANER